MFVTSFHKKLYTTKQHSNEDYVVLLSKAKAYDLTCSLANSMLKAKEDVQWSCAICNSQITINALHFDKMSIDKMLCDNCVSIDNVLANHAITIAKHLNSFRQFLQHKLYAYYNITDIKKNLVESLIHK